MDSQHFRTLIESLSSTLVSVIKEKIGCIHIHHFQEGIPLFISNPTGKKHGEIFKVKSLSHEFIVLEDDTCIIWDDIKNFNELISILEFLEEMKDGKSKDSFQIEWSISDFEDCATNIEEKTDGRKYPVFDRAKFRLALKILEDHHDYNLGINWNDVEFHLKRYCRIEN